MGTHPSLWSHPDIYAPHFFATADPISGWWAAWEISRVTEITDFKRFWPRISGSQTSWVSLGWPEVLLGRAAAPSCVPRKRLLGEFRSTFQSTSAYHCPSVCLGLNNHLILLKRKVTQISLFRMGSVGTNMEALEMRIKELELENMTLKSQLDKYQTIFNLQGETVGKQVWFRFHLSLDVKIFS